MAVLSSESGSDSVLSHGARHYLLLLLPSLIQDIERLGLRNVIAHASLDQHDVTSLYFEARSIARLLPERPEAVDSELWPDLVQCAQLLTLLVNETAREELARTRRQAINRFLPEARQQVRSAADHPGGSVDLRLAGLSRAGASAEDTCLEAIRLDRQRRFEGLRALTTDGLTRHQAAIVEGALHYVRDAMAQPPQATGALDLLISLCDLLRRLQGADSEPEPDAPPPRINTANVVMGLGNILYACELGLRRSAPQPGQRRDRTGGD
ncbi:hypothetical protein [Marinobacter bohaiensis]|uniref:hypothetical protein n=1 Tax=Marinobacter bohaiensis TaxID=2201898 RepID=UPI000DAB9192|nr:hypothetical protein [Marinobacter bohaiensis]